MSAERDEPAKLVAVEHDLPGGLRGGASGQTDAEAGGDPLRQRGGDAGSVRSPAEMDDEPPVQRDVAEVGRRDEEQGARGFAPAEKPADKDEVGQGRRRAPDTGIVVSAARLLDLDRSREQPEAGVAERIPERERQGADHSRQQEGAVEVGADLVNIAAAPGLGDEPGGAHAQEGTAEVEVVEDQGGEDDAREEADVVELAEHHRVRQSRQGHSEIRRDVERGQPREAPVEARFGDGRHGRRAGSLRALMPSGPATDNALARFVARVDRFNSRLGVAVSWLTLAMVAVGAYNAVVRYLGRFTGWNLSSNAYLELQWYMFSLVFLLGAAYALQTNAHVRVDVIFSRLPERWRRRIDLWGSLLFLIPFAVFGLVMSWPAVRNSWAVLEVSSDPGGLPRYPIKSVLLAAFTLLALQGLAEAVRNWQRLRALRAGAEEEDMEQEGLL